MLCNIKPVPFHESDKHIFAKIPGGVRTPGPPLWIRPWYIPIAISLTVHVYKGFSYGIIYFDPSQLYFNLIGLLFKYKVFFKKENDMYSR